MTKICTKCDKEIDKDYKMVPMDIPYLNLFFHKECFNELGGEIEEYLRNNLEDIIRNYPQKSTKNSKKSIKYT